MYQKGGVSMQIYDVDRTEWKAMGKSDRKTVRCPKKELMKMLADSRYTVWSARWINTALDKERA